MPLRTHIAISIGTEHTFSVSCIILCIVVTILVFGSPFWFLGFSILIFGSPFWFLVLHFGFWFSILVFGSPFWFLVLHFGFGSPFWFLVLHFGFGSPFWVSFGSPFWFSLQIGTVPAFDRYETISRPAPSFMASASTKSVFCW